MKDLNKVHNIIGSFTEIIDRALPNLVRNPEDLPLIHRSIKHLEDYEFALDKSLLTKAITPDEHLDLYSKIGPCKDKLKEKLKEVLNANPNA